MKPQDPLCSKTARIAVHGLPEVMVILRFHNIESRRKLTGYRKNAEFKRVRICALCRISQLLILTVIENKVDELNPLQL